MVYKLITEGNHLKHELSNSPISIIKIYSDSCAPCKPYGEVYKELAQQYPHIPFLDVNMTSNIIRVSAVPTTLIIKNFYIINKNNDGVWIVEKLLGGDINELHENLELQLNN